MKRIIIWNKEAERVLEAFNASEQEVVFEHSAMQQRLLEKDFTSVIVLVELSWDESPEPYYGLEVAARLRKIHKLCCPILLASYYPEEHLHPSKKNDIQKFNIICASGTGFIDLGSLRKKLAADKDIVNKKIATQPWLSPIQLMDINDTLLDIGGFVTDRITHDIKIGDAGKLEQSFNTLRGLLTDEQMLRINFQDHQKKITAAALKNDGSAFIIAKEHFIDVCVSLFDFKQGTADWENESPGKKIKLLIIEDDPEQSALIGERLGKHFDLIITNDCHHAISELDTDIKNDIIGVVADWRLLKHEDGKPTLYWQDYQGYEVLQRAARTHFAALFAFTAESDRNVNNIRNALGIKIHLFKKQHLFTHGDAQWELIADTISQECQTPLALISNKPNGKKWEKDHDEKKKFDPLSRKYFIQRSSIAWPVFEDNISKAADQLWDYYSQAINNELLDISSLQSIKERFRYTISAKEPILEDTLIVRRIYLALAYRHQKIYLKSFREKKWTDANRLMGEQSFPIKVYCVLNATNWTTYYDKMIFDKLSEKEFLTTDEFYKSLKEDASTFAFHLCIKTEDLAEKDILPEEIAWLISKGIDTKRGFTGDDDDEKKSPERNNSADSGKFNKEKEEAGPTDEEIKDSELPNLSDEPGDEDE